MKDLDEEESNNGPPFHFDIISGNNEATFSINNKGEIMSNKLFTGKLHSNFPLLVRVYDSGHPRLFSDTQVTIHVSISNLGNYFILILLQCLIHYLSHYNMIILLCSY